MTISCFPAQRHVDFPQPAAFVAKVQKTTNHPATPGTKLSAAELELFRSRCFWWVRPGRKLEDLPVEILSRYLRTHGGHGGWKLAARLCR